MVTIECPQCHYKNPDDAEFCEQCGAELPVTVGSVAANAPASAVSATGSIVGGGNSSQAVADDMVCPNCKAPYVQGDVFCFNCGQDLRNLPGNQPAAATANPNPAQAANPVTQPQIALPNTANISGNTPQPQPANNSMSIDDWDKAFSNPGTSAPVNNAPIAASTNSGTPAPVSVPTPPSSNGASSPTVNAFGAAPANNAFNAPVAPTNNPVQTASAPEHLVLDVNGPYGNQRIEYVGRELLFGRTDVKTRIFPDVNLDDSAASRRHMSIWLEPTDNAFYMQDLESANGTNLNGQDVEQGVPVRLNNGDILKIGTRYSLQVHIS